MIGVLVALTGWFGGGLCLWSWFFATGRGDHWIAAVADRTRQDWKDVIWPFLAWSAVLAVLATTALVTWLA